MSPSGFIKNYTSASIIISISGLLNGYDTGCIGAVTAMHQFEGSMGRRLSGFMHGITISVIILTSIFPSIFSGYLADRYGRLSIILPGALLFAAGAALQGTAFGLAQFIAGRAVAGLGQGMSLGNAAVYITEIAPLRRRGRLASLPQFMATAGVCLGYFSCFGTGSIPSSLAWRLPYLAQVALSLALALACRIVPESPRWLCLHGRSADAVRALQRLDFDMDEARRDFLAIEQQPSVSGWNVFLLMFRRGYRARTLLALFFLGAVQLSGIDAITYYAPALFTQAGISSNQATFVASGVSSLAMLAVSVPAFLMLDKWGRRTSTITGGLSLCGCMFVIGSLYAAGVVNATGAARWVVIVCVFLFGMVYNATWNIVCKVYASEIQPGNTRAAANSVAMGLNYFTNWIVALVTPILLAGSDFSAYFLFGGLTFIAVCVLAAFMPETRGRSLEDIQESFQHTGSSSILSRYLGRILKRAAPERRDQNTGAIRTTRSLIDVPGSHTSSAVDLPVLRA